MTSQTVVITGASSGIGRATALAFARRGARLVLAARGTATLEALAAECRRRGAPSAIAVPTDVTDPDAVDRLLDRAVAQFARVDVWVNVAGISSFAAFAEAPLADIRRVLDVNVMGVVHGARAALRAFRSQRKGVLINVASLLGEVPQPYTAAYSMSKAAVRSLGASLRSELALAGLRDVHVATILPATIDTPFFRHAANRTGRTPLAMPPVYPPQLVADAIVRAASSPKAEIPVGALGKLLTAQHRMTPKAVDGLLAAETEALQLGPDGTAATTDGTIFETDDDPSTAAVEGGWHGRARTRGRSVLAVAGVILPAVLLVRHLRRR